MRAIVVDDEKNVRTSLIRLLNTFCPEVKVVGEGANIQSSLKLIEETDFDLLFLDVELPDGSGMDLLKKIEERHFQVIFVTAYNQYAIDAFQLSAIGYLLKPVDPDHLIDSVKKANRLIGNPISKTELSVLLDHLQPTVKQDSKIILRDADNLYVVQIKEILRCVADGSYTRFSLSGNRTVVTSIHLKEYEKLLSKWGFVRSHHSHLINIHHVVRFNKANGGMVVLNEGIEVPVSFRKKELLIQALQRIAL